MNPVDRFKIDNYKQVLREIEQIGKIEYLRDLEDKVIQEIINLVNEGTEEAKADLIRLEKALAEALDFTPRNHLLISALKNSISGALSVAKFCLF